MSYVVTAPLVLAVDEDGATHHRYEGELIEWLSDDQAEHFLGAGLVAEAGQVPADPGPGDDVGDDAADPGPGDDRPATVATKDVLIDWLMAHGTYDRAELEGQVKDDLWALIDATD